MIDRLSQRLNLKPGEWKLAFPLLMLLAINTLVFELSDVVSTAGFVSNIGLPQIPWLWIVDMVIILLLSGGYALVVDRVPRVQLISWLFGGFAGLYLLLVLLFRFGAPDLLNYPLLYILADQQWAIFPLAFWALANDVYTLSEAKRLFPVMGAGAAIGSSLGNGLAAASAFIFSKYGGNVSQLLMLNAFILMVGFVLLRLTFRYRPVHARQSQEREPSLQEAVQTGLDYFKNVPLFRYLSLAMLSGYLAYTIIQYYFFYTLDQTFPNELGFQSFFGLYNIILIVCTLLFQWLLTGRLLARLELRSAFIIFPATLFLAAGWALVVPGLVGGVLGYFLLSVLEQAWDIPARKSIQSLIPDERRGRVSTFLDSYLYVLAVMAGCLILILLQGGSILPAQASVIIYLIVATLAAAGAIWAAIRLRSGYEQSLLNWRLARSRRKSMLDGIEF